MNYIERDKLDDIYEWPIKGIPAEYVLPDGPDYEHCDERWKHSSLPGVMVSDYGRFYNTITQRFIKPTHGDGGGHKAVKVQYKNKRAQAYAHRLIAEAFVENPNNYPIVRHLNDDPSDNDIDNLAWGTFQDNMDDMWRNGHGYEFSEEDREKYLSKQRKPIIAVNMNTGEKIYFNSTTKASKELGLHQANIWKVLNGERTHTKEYYFYYVNGENNE